MDNKSGCIPSYLLNLANPSSCMTYCKHPRQAILASFPYTYFHSLLAAVCNYFEALHRCRRPCHSSHYFFSSLSLLSPGPSIDRSYPAITMNTVTRTFGKFIYRSPGDNARVSVLLKDYEDVDKLLAKVCMPLPSKCMESLTTIGFALIPPLPIWV